MKFNFSLLLTLAIAGCSANLGTPEVRAADDIVIADFEKPTFDGWKTEGAAFGTGPAIGVQIGRLEMSGVRGNGVASSEWEGDKPKGKLTSPAFKIERRYLSFVIGGGGYEIHTCMNLLIDGKVVRSATGPFSDVLKPVSWDLKAYAGKTAQLQMVDEASGNWGHINVDHILLTDAPEKLPVTTQPLYRETFRPQVHFTARQWTTEKLNPGMREDGWLNDLNGMIFYDGEYHMFAQRWNKCWIHAVSKDLVHWTELEPAFWEEWLDSAVQSGTCVIDYKNSSGLSPDPKNPPMVAFWSRNDNKSHGISYSLDHGRTWKHYDKNPILVKPERDPKVFWHEPSGHWVMMMYGEGKYHVLTSDNLINWTDAKKPLGNSYECPDFFELPIDGKKENSKWALIRADGRYSLGTFDGTEFKEETEQFTSDVGPNFYATQTFDNVNTGDGRRIQVAWMRGGAYPDMPFNQQVTFPCLLTLRSTPDGARMFREPVAEISKLHAKEQKLDGKTIGAGQTLPLESSGDAYHLKFKVEIPAGSILTLNVRGALVTLSSDGIANGTDKVKVRGTLKTVEVIIDRTSIEVFGNDGEVSSSRCYLPGAKSIAFEASGGAATIQSGSAWLLESMWKGNPLHDAAAK